MLPSVALGSGAAVQNTPKPLPAPHARIVQPRRSAPLACGCKGSGFRTLGFWEQRSWRREGKGEGATCSHWRKDSSLASSAAAAAMAVCGVR